MWIHEEKRREVLKVMQSCVGQALKKRGKVGWEESSYAVSRFRHFVHMASELLSAGHAELKCGWTDVGEAPPRGPDVHPLLQGGGGVGSIIISQ